MLVIRDSAILIKGVAMCQNSSRLGIMRIMWYTLLLFRDDYTSSVSPGTSKCFVRARVISGRYLILGSRADVATRINPSPSIVLKQNLRFASPFHRVRHVRRETPMAVYYRRKRQTFKARNNRDLLPSVLLQMSECGSTGRCR